MPRPLKVFLCHASQDKPAVRKMYFYLKQHGVQPWLDREDLLPGQDWEVEIPKAIFTSDVILVCLSANSVNKEGYVQKEIAFALDKAMEKPQGTIFIIPVKLEECIVPSRLSRYQWVDYYRPDGRKKLLMGLNMRVQGLGEDVSPVIMEDSRQRATRTQPIKEEVLKEPQKEPLVQNSPVVESRSDKLVQAKPFTRILDPSKLAPQKTLAKTNKRPDTKRLFFGLGGLALIGLFFLGLYVFSPPPSELKPTSTPTLMEFIKTPKPPTATHAPATDTPEPIPTLGIGSTMVSEKDGMVMVYVPAGEFYMGSNLTYDEQPIHQVYLDDFWIDRTEATNDMFAKFLNDIVSQILVNSDEFVEFSGNTIYDLICSGCSNWTDRILWDGTRFTAESGYEKHPVVLVTWYGANAYCGWANRRLPTEAEWEKTASWNDSNKEKYDYPWGNEFSCKNGNFDDETERNSYVIPGGVNCDGYSDTSPVGSFPLGISSYGAVDMAGNVWEWVSDWYSYSYYANSPLSNPLGPASGQYRALRGGAWIIGGSDVRSAYRYGYNPTNTYYNVGNVGFRCAISPP